MLTSSLLLFAAAILVVAAMSGASLKDVVLTGVAAAGAVLASSLAVSFVPVSPDADITAYAVRFAAPLVVLGLANPRGRWTLAGLQLVWIWSLLDLLFVLRTQAVPQLAQFGQDYMPVYPALPVLACLLMQLGRLRRT